MTINGGNQPEYYYQPGDNSRHYQSPWVAVGIPVLQSLVSGVLFGFAMGVIAAVAKWQSPWGWFWACLAISQVIVWAWRLIEWADMVKLLEQITMMDLNGDGEVGADYEAQKKITRIEIVRDNGRTVQFADLPASETQLTQLAQALLVAGSSGDAPRIFAAESQWCGTGKPFSKREFRRLRETMLKVGYLAWINERYHAQGVTLTRTGVDVLSQYLKTQLPSPTAGRSAQIG